MKVFLLLLLDGRKIRNWICTSYWRIRIREAQNIGTGPMDPDSAPDPQHYKKEELSYHWAPVLENALPGARKAQPSRVKYKKIV